MNLKAKVVSDFSRHDVKSRTSIEIHEQRLPAKRSLPLFSAVCPTKVADYVRKRAFGGLQITRLRIGAGIS